MLTGIPPFRRVLVVAHPKIPSAIREAAAIAAFLEERGVEAFHGSLYNEALHYHIQVRQADLMIALGGDGTMLRAGHLCGRYQVPLLGIHMGKVGFLMDIRQEQWQEALTQLLAGHFWLEKRMMLITELWRSGEKIGSWDAINEAVVSRGEMVRLVHLETYVDGHILTTYVADGLIVSTPTGSTAYALAAGGPILPPELRNILLVPLAPHRSLDRAIVLAEGSTVSIVVHTDHQAVLCIDGQPPISLHDQDRVTVKAGEHTVEFLHLQDPGYFYHNLTYHMHQNHS